MNLTSIDIAAGPFRMAFFDYLQRHDLAWVSLTVLPARLTGTVL
jgi:hypothetical protein